MCIFQITAICCGFLATGLSFAGTLRGWRDDPMLISFASVSRPVTLLQFPSVTVCQEVRVFVSHFY
jgi:hypothetical protein